MNDIKTTLQKERKQQQAVDGLIQRLDSMRSRAANRYVSSRAVEVIQDGADGPQGPRTLFILGKKFGGAAVYEKCEGDWFPMPANKALAIAAGK